MKMTPSNVLLATVIVLSVGGCSEQIHSLRESRLANGEQAQPFNVRESLQSTQVYLNDQNKVREESAAALNTLLSSQGALKNQHLLLIPATDDGVAGAEWIAQKLVANGALTSQIDILRKSAAPAESGDLQLISRATVIDIPECTNDTETWTVNPYAAFNNLGCANRANIARMVSDPRDMARPRVLTPADGVHAQEAIARYHESDTFELINIDFSNDD